ncbi:helix-turn-helix transcriptional regulator [Fictibacillus sp. 23RED33]|uniref:helix-turn-helix domain-containing protein n=1 Tax=Fictibacillus sp. 23RED33 TaxID=2745879 RepID=UPI0018CC8C1F|nr:AraC family transcriptional regulator [Fictibacillus sp. 23RED33]MBH0173488.1 helix-turn-helix transcriptional regulator [Fictibacillus sp. 23RED33]
MEIQGVYHDVNPTWRIGKDRGCATLVYVTQGKVMYWIDGVGVELVKGEILYIPSGVDRAWENHADESHQKYTVVFLWESENLRKILHYTTKNEMYRYKTFNTPYFEQRFSSLFTQILLKKPYFEWMARCILSELLTQIAQESSEVRTAPSKERIANEIQDYILRNFRSNVTIDDLSSLAGVTPNYVSGIFKEVVGSTPIQYLHQLRINTSLHLLQNTQMTISEIAEYLGYCDQSYFNRVFKKWMGVAPSKYNHHYVVS